MSKINARSPYYLTYVTPTKPTPALDCTKVNLSDYTVDTNGTITLPTLDYGYIDSFTSTASDFANDKFAPVGSSTTRTVTFKIIIPNGFSNSQSNSGVGHILCNKTSVQQAAACSGGPTANGSIPAQSMTAGGDTDTVNLASFFNAGSVAIAGYRIVNSHKSFVNMSISGSTLTLTALNVGGTNVVYVEAFDNAVNTCIAIQAISVTVNVSNNLGCTASTGVDSVGLTGGAIAQDGTITNPNLIGTITQYRLSLGGSAVTSPLAANSGSSAQNITLFFVITVPAGYGNAGGTPLVCSKVFSQPGSNLGAFTCDTTTLTDQSIYSDGTIKTGDSTIGEIETTTPIKFLPIVFPFQRSVIFNIRVPSGYTNANDLFPCTLPITQPGGFSPCATSTVSYFIQLSVSDSVQSTFCNLSGVGPTHLIKSSAVSIDQAQGATVCNTINGQVSNPYFGNDRYWRVSTFSNSSSSSGSSGDFYLWKISVGGIVTEVYKWNCAGGNQGNGVKL